MSASARQRRDWVGKPRSYILAWGLPTLALVLAGFVEPSARTIIWCVALLWMGAACVLNATRCGRTHCYFTGPFFLAMAAAVALHGTETVWLGPAGWVWLGVVLAVGGFGLFWLVPEQLWGKFLGTSRSSK